MYCKYILLIFALQIFADCFNSNVFQYINDELDILTSIEGNTNTRWILQELDHFDPKETRKWYMRYFERLDYWKLNGPIYLFVGGESQASENWTRVGIMHDLAKETHGAMFVSEHRYYGKSIPLYGISPSSLKYLSSKQAIVDIAKLMKSLKFLPQYKTSKVVVIGGSYAGNLATWLKSLYPELVDATLASSAPLIAKVDFFEYLEKVSNNYKQYGTNGCIERIREIFLVYEKLFKMMEENRPVSIEEKSSFFLKNVSPFMNNSQYGTVMSIKNHCKMIQNNLLFYKHDFKNDNNLINNTDFFKEEYDSNLSSAFSSKKMLHNNDFNLINDSVSWEYQSCTEFGYFQSSSSDFQPFTKNIPLQFFIDRCTRMFGLKYHQINKGVKIVNMLYRGLQPKVTKVIFSNGELDPWSTLSILNAVSYDNPVVILPKASHCRDLLAKKDEPLEIKKVIEFIKSVIKKWIDII